MRMKTREDIVWELATSARLLNAQWFAVSGLGRFGKKDGVA